MNAQRKAVVLFSFALFFFSLIGSIVSAAAYYMTKPNEGICNDNYHIF
jgi:hypothetical protein